MYLRTLKLWNFRKYGKEGEIDLDIPHLQVNFNNALNVLIGENDSGKTAVIDAIKLVLKTHSIEWVHVEDSDFHNDCLRLRIECIFDDLTTDEAKNFIEWLGMEGEGENAKPYLRLILDVVRTSERILPYDVKAGVDNEGSALSAEAKDFFKATYLKPLRDAKTELAPRKNSRLSQILMGHEAFKKKGEDHVLKDIFSKFIDEVMTYFKEGHEQDKNGKALKDRLDTYLQKLLGKTAASNFSISNKKLKDVLEILKLTLMDENLGLGSQNLLFIATELLNLERTDWCGLRLALIEELEAHLHPPAQMKLVEFLQETIKELNTAHNCDVQLILTSHSPNLGSKIKLENLIICENNQASPTIFSMGKQYTKLKETDYKFLERFLDVTNANLFFSKGVILVEGSGEELILPSLAKHIGVNLTERGVSIINVGSTALLRYARIFQRKDEPHMSTPIALITDLDIKPIEAKPQKVDPSNEENKIDMTDAEINQLKQVTLKRKKEKFSDQVVHAFISPEWTLEFCISLSEKLRKLFYKAVLEALKEKKEDEEVENLLDYESAITNIDEHYNNWQDDRRQVAYSIYSQILGEEKVLNLAKEKISKAIIAQHFAQILDDTEIVNDLYEDESIKYLLDAIKYASKEDNNH